MDAAVSQSTRSKRSHLHSATYSLADVAGLLGVSYTSLHEQVRTGTAPVPPIKVGRQYRSPKATVDRLLGLEPACDASAA